MGNHTSVVQRGITLGFILFVVSEVLFFFSIFWAFFHSALSPAVELGAVWPPEGILALNPSIILNLCFISPTPVLFLHLNLNISNEDPIDFSMATWAKDALYGLLFTRGAYIRVNLANKRGIDGNA